jgi:hypothetical protein
MFLAGLKFALGLVVGLSLLSGIATLGIFVTAIFDGWRKKRRGRLWNAKSLAQSSTPLQFRERAVFQLNYRTDDWLLESDKPERLP